MDQEDNPKEALNKESKASEQLEFEKDNALNTDGNDEILKTGSKASASRKQQ